MPHMEVNIDKAGREVQARHIHQLFRLFRGNAGLKGRDLTFNDGHVQHRIQLVGGVNHVTAFENQVVPRRLCLRVVNSTGHHKKDCKRGHPRLGATPSHRQARPAEVASWACMCCTRSAKLCGPGPPLAHGATP